MGIEPQLDSENNFQEMSDETLVMQHKLKAAGRNNVFHGCKKGEKRRDKNWEIREKHMAHFTGPRGIREGGGRGDLSSPPCW